MHMCMHMQGPGEAVRSGTCGSTQAIFGAAVYTWTNQTVYTQSHSTYPLITGKQSSRSTHTAQHPNPTVSVLGHLHVSSHMIAFMEGGAILCFLFLGEKAVFDNYTGMYTCMYVYTYICMHKCVRESLIECGL